MELSLVHAIQAVWTNGRRTVYHFSDAPGKQVFDLPLFVQAFSHTCLQFAAVYFGQPKSQNNKGREFVVSEIKYCQWIFAQKAD